ncbi:TPA: hypothetical protein KE548_000769 [Proteus mirabilis]|nr:hypothetical protein [Proteus mirabilis]
MYNTFKLIQAHWVPRPNEETKNIDAETLNRAKEDAIKELQSQINHINRMELQQYKFHLNYQ